MQGMKPLKCDFCNGDLIMDDSREFATCEFCGTKYMKSTIQAKIQEICGKVSVEGTVKTKESDFAVVGGVLKKYNGESVDVVIPNNVIVIDSRAFDSCKMGLRSVVIPDSVTRIYNSAFDGCSSLTSITIPNSVTSIGESVFSGCRSLTSVTIGDGVTSIGYGVFSGCSSLTSVTIPDSVTRIGGHAFQDCDSLASVAIPDSVTSIGGHAFSGCSSLTSITIPNSVTSIGESVFSGCSSLTSVTIPNNITYVGEEIFDKCKNLKNLSIGDAFVDFKDIPRDYKGVEDIDRIFGNCEKLENVNVSTSNNLYSSEGGVLFNKNKTTLIYYPRGKHGDYVIPNTVKNISDRAFYRCTSLTHITISDNVTIVGQEAFSCCYNLKSAILPQNIKYSCCVEEPYHYGHYVRVMLPQKPEGPYGATPYDTAFREMRGGGIFEICGKLTECCYPIQIQDFLGEDFLNLVRQRIHTHVCRYCGGEFKGMFNRVCSVCGKPKDYRP